MSHTKQSTGSVKRLSVAVLIDEKRVTAADGSVTSEKVPPEQLEAIQKLVRDAVGFDEHRGDSIQREQHALLPEPCRGGCRREPGLLQSPTVQSFGKQGLAAHSDSGAVAVVLVRPLLRAMSGGTGGGSGRPRIRWRRCAAGVHPPEQRGPLSYDDKISVARQLADKNPKRVAQIVRAWVQADG